MTTLQNGLSSLNVKDYIDIYYETVHEVNERELKRSAEDRNVGKI